MSTTYSSPTVRFDRLPSQGIVYGFDATAVTVLAIAAFVGGGAVVRDGLLGLVITLPITVPLAVLGIVKRHGQPLLTHVLREVVGTVRKALGATTYRARPERRTKNAPVSQLNVPGREGRMHVFEAPNGAVVVVDATKQTATVSCQIATRGLGLPQGGVPATLTDEERDALIFSWATVLGSFTQKEHITRVAVIEQTRPGTVAAEQVYFEERALVDLPGVPDSYREALVLAEQAVVAHVTQLAVTFRVSGEAKTLVRGAGGGVQGLLALAELEMVTIEDALWQSGFTKIAWLTSREWGAWGRAIIDPKSQQATDARIGTPFEGVDPHAAVPTYVDEHRVSVETDSAWHRTYWIQEWPRYDTYPGFLSRLVFAQKQSGLPVRHTFALVATPVPVSDAMKRIDEQKRTWITNANLRAKSGKPQSAADEADWQAIAQHEADLVAGQGELQFSAYLTVTAPTEKDLEVEAASMMNACAATGLEPRVMPWQQAEALMNVAYPCGLGMK